MPAVPFSRLETEALALYAPPLRRKATWFKVRRVLQEFRELDGVRKTTDINAMSMALWLETYSHRAPMTNRSYLASFRPVCNYAKKMGYLKLTPWDIRRDWILFDLDEEDEPEKARHLSMDEIDLFMAQLDADALAGGWLDWRRQALGYMYIHTGLRNKEALGLKCADVHLERRVLRVRSRRQRKLKTRTSARVVGISPDLADVLARWIPRTGSEWLFPGIRRLTPWMHGSPGKKPLDELKAAAARAGLGHVTIHMFRRSLSTHARRLGITKDEMMDTLGHGSLKTQEDWYLEPDADNARELASRIRFRRTQELPPSRPVLTN
jgi:integrase